MQQTLLVVWSRGTMPTRGGVKPELKRSFEFPTRADATELAFYLFMPFRTFLLGRRPVAIPLRCTVAATHTCHHFTRLAQPSSILQRIAVLHINIHAFASSKGLVARMAPQKITNKRKRRIEGKWFRISQSTDLVLKGPVSAKAVS